MDRKPFNNGGTGTAFLWNFVQGGMDMATLEKINAFLKAVNAAAWGPPLLFLLLGTGIFLTIQLRALPIRRLFFAPHKKSGASLFREAPDFLCISF